MKIAACYIRVSTDDQLEYSPDSQLEKIKDFCKRNDMILPEDNIFIEEEGVSGRKASKRHEFQEMIARAKTKPKPFDVIVVWKFSRFARNREDSIVYKSMLRKELGIEVVSVSENIGDDKMSVITEAIIEAMDEYYSLNLGEEVRRGMTARAKQGEPCSIAPFGYKLVDKKLVIYPEQAEIIREVFNRYIAGWGQKQIADWLNSIGVKSNRGSMIEQRTVNYWLYNPVYHGYVRWTPNGKTRRDFWNPDSMIVKGSHEPIIDDETWDAAQKRLEEIRAKFHKYRRQNPPIPYMLSGVVKCSACGASLSQTRKGKYMQCINYAHALCTESHHVKVEDLELLLLSTIESDLKRGTFQIERAVLPKVNSDSAAISTQIERAEQKLQRVKEAYENGIDTLQEYKENKQKITAELEELRKKAASSETKDITEAERKEFAERHLKTLEKLKSPDVSEAEKNRLLKEFIKTATFSKTDRSVSVVYLF